jgi:hypothetical protein
MAFCTNSNTRSAVPLQSLAYTSQPMGNGSLLTRKTDTQRQNAHSNAQPEHSIWHSSPPQSLDHPSSTLLIKTNQPTTSLSSLSFTLTSQPDILRNYLQILWPSQFRTQLATSLHDIPTELFIPLVTPVVVLATAAEDDAAAERAREDVGGCGVDALRGAHVPVILLLAMFAHWV